MDTASTATGSATSPAAAACRARDALSRLLSHAAEARNGYQQRQQQHQLVAASVPAAGPSSSIASGSGSASGAQLRRRPRRMQVASFWDDTGDDGRANRDASGGSSSDSRSSDEGAGSLQSPGRVSPAGGGSGRLAATLAAASSASATIWNMLSPRARGGDGAGAPQQAVSGGGVCGAEAATVVSLVDARTMSPHQQLGERSSSSYDHQSPSRSPPAAASADGRSGGRSLLPPLHPPAQLAAHQPQLHQHGVLQGGNASPPATRSAGIMMMGRGSPAGRGSTPTGGEGRRQVAPSALQPPLVPSSPVPPSPVTSPGTPRRSPIGSSATGSGGGPMTVPYGPVVMPSPSSPRTTTSYTPSALRREVSRHKSTTPTPSASASGASGLPASPASSPPPTPRTAAAAGASAAAMRVAAAGSDVAAEASCATQALSAAPAANAVSAADTRRAPWQARLTPIAPSTCDDHDDSASRSSVAPPSRHGSFDGGLGHGASADGPTSGIGRVTAAVRRTARAALMPIRSAVAGAKACYGGGGGAAAGPPSGNASGGGRRLRRFMPGRTSASGSASGDGGFIAPQQGQQQALQAGHWQGGTGRAAYESPRGLRIRNPDAAAPPTTPTAASASRGHVSPGPLRSDASGGVVTGSAGTTGARGWRLWQR